MIIDLLRHEDITPWKITLQKDSGFPQNLTSYFIGLWIHLQFEKKKGILTIQWLALINPFYQGQAEPSGQENQI